MCYNGSTINTNIELSYDPEALSNWELFWNKYGRFVLGTVELLAGLALCLTGYGGGLGVGLIIGGGSTLISEGLTSAGMNSRGAMQVESTLTIAAGVLLCFTALAPLGASLIGAGACGLIGGLISEKVGGNYSVGWVIGNVVGGILGSYAYQGVQAIRKPYNQCGRECFIAGTLVLCRDENGEESYKPIEEIEVGDMVWAYDEETGESDWKPVVRLFRNESKDWTIVKINGEEIESTPGHKYYLPEKKAWKSASLLKKGDKVLLSSGGYAIIEFVKSKHYDKPQTTYNFEVKDFHTYFIGIGVCVHNRGCNVLKPDPNAKGAHSTFRRDPKTGQITHYATYEPNPLNPTGFDEVLRYDGVGKAHGGIPTPHVEGKSIPGRVRAAYPWEIPRHRS